MTLNTLFDSDLCLGYESLSLGQPVEALSSFLRGLSHTPGLFPVILGAIRLVQAQAQQRIAESTHAYIFQPELNSEDHTASKEAENFLYDLGFSLKQTRHSSAGLSQLADTASNTLVLVSPGDKELAFACLHQFIWKSEVYCFTGSASLSNRPEIQIASNHKVSWTVNSDCVFNALELHQEAPGLIFLAYLLPEFKSTLSFKNASALLQNIFQREIRFLTAATGEQPNVLPAIEQMFCRPSNIQFVDRLFKIAMGRMPHHLEYAYSLEALRSGRLNRYSLMEEIFSSDASRNHLRERKSGAGPARPAPVIAVPERKNFPLEGVRLRAHHSPLVSIIIPVYGKLPFTLQCLTSLSKWHPKNGVEVIVVDDCGPDDTTEVLQQIVGIRVHRNASNLGFIKSCNQGAKLARGQYLLFLNNDTELQENSVDALVETFLQFPDCGLVGAKLVYPDGSLQEAGGIVWKDGNACNYGRNDNPDRPEYNYLRDVDYLSGAAIAIPRSLFGQLGGFDEKYCPAYYEDTDLAFKVRKLGLRVLYQPASVVVHYEGVSHGASVESGLKAYQLVNKGKFFETWREELELNHHSSSVALSLARERRSATSRQILVIDHYLPQPDRDAGSRSIFHIVEAMLAMGLSVKFWPHNNHYDKPYARLLESSGVEVIAGDHTVGKFAEWMSRHGAHVDTVFLSRPRVAVDFIQAVRSHSKAKIVYYGHDIHHQRLSQQLIHSPSESLRREMEEFKEIEHRLWQELDVLYYPSLDEEEFVSQWWRQNNVTGKVVRTIPVYAYSDFPNAPKRSERDSNKLLFVAGFNHAPNQDAAVYLVHKVLPLVRQKLPNCVLYLVGSNPSAVVQNLQTTHVVVTGSVSDQELQEHYASSVVMIAPLLYGGGMKGKVIESMRNQLPVVTTSIGVQGLPHIDNCLGVADNAEDIAAKVCELVSNESKWQAQSQNAFGFVKEKFSRAALQHVITQDLN